MKLYIYGAAAVAVLLLGWAYGHSRYNAGERYGRADVQADWDADKAVAAEALRVANEANAQLKSDNAAIAKEMDDELKPALVAATDRGDALSRQLRRHQTRACSSAAVPGAAETPAVASGASGEPSDGGAPETAIDLATDQHFAAAARDAERLNGWEAWWVQVEERWDSFCQATR